MNQPSIFVVEDDAAVRDSLLVVLRAEGLRARGFASGTDFLDNLPADPVACLITDLRMPGIDGVELVHRVMALPDRAWSVVVITGHGDVASAVALMKQGIADFIEKPFEPQRLIETVKGCVSRMHDISAERREAIAVKDRLEQLTVRERQVFDGLVLGQSNKEIAAALTISPRTVEIFRAKMMDKMQADNLSALVRMGVALTRTARQEAR
ncbi:MAG: response regulator [Oxalobacteraceae bacterium]|nr:MAG: response regulator [Oxalobacteraceae bacterium]